MIRLFDQFTKRKTTLLDGLWQFKTDPHGLGEEEAWYESFPEDGTDMVVPSCWNNESGLYSYEGIAWYARTFRAQGCSKLVFHGITGEARVYLDGSFIGSHYGGFTGFEILLGDLEDKNHLLVIAVDNTHDDDNTIPLAVVDWFHYGGITRSVELMALSDLWVEDLKVYYDLSHDLNTADLSVAAKLRSSGDTVIKDTLQLRINDELVQAVPVEIKGEDIITLKVTLDDIILWDTDAPNLYKVTAELSEDDYTDRIGFRKIEARGRKLYLNNNELYLKGVNRHEDHPDWGFAMPFKLMKKDMDIIKDLGCNMIRGAHYPNAPIFLDLCDQEGILFWDEIPMWGFPEKVLENPLVIDRGLVMHEEMVVRDYHHPSIILWGMHNEVATDTQAGYKITKVFADKVRSLDSTRPLTYATNRALRDICFDLVDVIGINKYIGWYMDGLEAWPAYLDKFDQKAQEEGNADKPILMSEFGAGAVYGARNLEAPKWSEDYQMHYLDYTLDLYNKDPRISGAIIWQYCDIRTNSVSHEMGRPRGFNNKGIVNEYRQPKMAYHTVKKHFGG